MKSRSRADPHNPLGFAFQANVHGWDRYDGSQRANTVAKEYGWHGCQHGHQYFLVWHRMYLFFMERIMRRVANAPQLALPYWDYFNATQRAIPQPFRIPADPHANPLYVSERCDDVNRGKPMNPQLVNPNPALRTAFFATNKQNNELNVCHALGGARIDAPAFQSEGEGLLEMIPHNNVHMLVGGPGGFMSDNCMSARDPIFLVHHAQVDRIWESWVRIRGRGQPPLDSRYLNQTFHFWDENGRRVSVRVADFLDTGRLGYRYDTYVELSDREPEFKESPKLWASVNASALSFKADRLSATLPIEPGYEVRFAQMARQEVRHLRSSLQLSVGYLESDVIFHVYLNLPAQSQAYEQSPYFIGALAYIPTKCVSKTRRQAVSVSITNCYDVTTNLNQLLADSLLYTGGVPRELNLTFVPKSCDEELEGNWTHELVAINRVLLVHYFL
jgi:hypothetical protein